MTAGTFVVRARPDGEVVETIDFPEDFEGHGLVQYVISEKPPLRAGWPPRFLVYLVLVADGLLLNDNLPVATCDTQAAAHARATVGFDA